MQDTRLWLQRKKRFIGTFLGLMLFAASVSAVSWGIAEAVSEGKITIVNENLITLENITVELANITETNINSLNLDLLLLDKVLQ